MQWWGPNIINDDGDYGDDDGDVGEDGVRARWNGILSD